MQKALSAQGIKRTDSMKMPYPLPHLTRMQAQTLMQSLIDDRRPLSDAELAGMLRYLAPPLPPKVAVTPLDYVAKTGTEIHVSRGIAYSKGKGFLLQAQVDLPDGLYCAKTLLPVDYDGEIQKVNFSGEGMPAELKYKTPKIAMVEGYKFDAKLIDLAFNNAPIKDLRLLYKKDGKFVGLAGTTDVGKFIVGAVK